MKNGNCTLCTDHCNNDPTCFAVECGTFHCLGWKDGKCSNVKQMTIVTRSNLKTCVKKFETIVGMYRSTKQKVITQYLILIAY